MDIQDLKPINDDNQQNWTEGSLRVKDVNDAGRADEGMICRWFLDWNGSKITAGTATAYTITSDTVPTAYYDGFLLVAEIHVENTGAATLNVDSLGAVNIVKNGGEALEAGDLPAGHIAIFVYRGTDFNLIATKIGSAGTKNTGTAIGDVVALEDVDGEAGLPAVDGSQLTGVSKATGIVVEIQEFLTDGTFDKSTIDDALGVWVEARASGGAGWGANSSSSSTNGNASGGGQGGKVEGWIDSADLNATEAVVVGQSVAGQTGAAANGQDSSFGSHMTANGGKGGTGSDTSANEVRPGGDGGQGTAAATVKYAKIIPGVCGGKGVVIGNSSTISGGEGGGEGGRPGIEGNGRAAFGIEGAGGEGAAAQAAGVYTGGSSAQGYVRVTVYRMQ